MTVLSMADLDLADQRVLIREDLNVPVKNGKVTSAKRIQAALPTIQLALDKGAKVILLSHRGRPEDWNARYAHVHCSLAVGRDGVWMGG